MFPPFFLRKMEENEKVQEILGFYRLLNKHTWKVLKALKRKLNMEERMTTNSFCPNNSAYKNKAWIDIHCEIQAVPFAQLSQMEPGEPSAVIRERVIKARQIQTERFSHLPLGGRREGGFSSLRGGDR